MVALFAPIVALGTYYLLSRVAPPLGAALGGRLAGARIAVIKMGPYAFRSPAGERRLRLGREPARFGGAAYAVCHPAVGRERLTTGLCVAGSLLPLTVAGGATVALTLAARTAFSDCVGVAVLFLVTIKLLCHSSEAWSESVGTLLATIEGGKHAARASALVAIESAARVGIRPRDWDPEVVARATCLADRSRADVTGCLWAYYHALDAGNGPSAADLVERMLAGAGRRAWTLRTVLLFEGAYFAIRCHDDLPRARELMRRAAGVSDHRQNLIRMFARLQPVLCARVVCARRLAEGDRDGAIHVARTALQLRAGQSRAHRHLRPPTYELEWLEEMLAVAEAAEPTAGVAPEAAHAYVELLTALGEDGGRRARKRYREWALVAYLGAGASAVLAGLEWFATLPQSAAAVELDWSPEKLAQQHTFYAVGFLLSAGILALALLAHRRPRMDTLMAALGASLALGAVDWLASANASAPSAGAIIAALPAAMALLGSLQMLGIVRLGSLHAVGGAPSGGRLTKPAGARTGRLGGMRLSPLIVLALVFALPVGVSAMGGLGNWGVAQPQNDHISGDPRTAKFTFVFEKGVSKAQRQAIEDGAQLAQAYFAETFGTYVQRPVRIDGRWTHPASVDFGGFARTRSVVLYTASEDGTQYPTNTLYEGIIHELFHVLQAELSADQDRVLGPQWLVEGSAELVAQRAIASESGADLGQLHDCLVWRLGTNQAASPPLNSLLPYTASSGPINGWYAQSALGVESALGGRGMGALRIYFERLRSATDWTDAFRSAFGESADSFFQQFATLRPGFQRPASYPCDYYADDYGNG